MEKPIGRMWSVGFFAFGLAGLEKWQDIRYFAVLTSLPYDNISDLQQDMGGRLPFPAGRIASPGRKRR